MGLARTGSLKGVWGETYRVGAPCLAWVRGLPVRARVGDRGLGRALGGLEDLDRYSGQAGAPQGQELTWA